METDPDSVRFVGQVLARNLEPFLAILGDIVVRPQLSAAEMERTRREIEAQIDESRNDDQTLCTRFFTKNLYGDHPYGHSPDGSRADLDNMTADEVAAHFRKQFVGRNLIFAASGDVEPGPLAVQLGRAFNGLREGPNEKQPVLRVPVPASGWRIQLVDKPDRQQTQIMFGHAGPPASDPDLVALEVAFAAFGGHGMTSTLMDEVRTKRGLAYGAYLSLSERRGAGAISGWVFSGNDKVVATLKLVLKLYLSLMEKGLDPARVETFKTFLAGSYVVGDRCARAPAGGARRRRARWFARRLGRHLRRPCSRHHARPGQRRDRQARARARSGDHHGVDRVGGEEAAGAGEDQGQRRSTWSISSATDFSPSSS